MKLSAEEIRRMDEACRVAEEERIRTSKIKAIEARIASLNLQFETMKAKLGEGPHVLALGEGTKMAVQELSERLVALRAGRPDPHE